MAESIVYSFRMPDAPKPGPDEAALKAEQLEAAEAMAKRAGHPQREAAMQAERQQASDWLQAAEAKPVQTGTDSNEPQHCAINAGDSLQAGHLPERADHSIPTETFIDAQGRAQRRVVHGSGFDQDRYNRHMNHATAAAVRAQMTGRAAAAGAATADRIRKTTHHLEEAAREIQAMAMEAACVSSANVLPPGVRYHHQADRFEVAALEVEYAAQEGHPVARAMLQFAQDHARREITVLLDKQRQEREAEYRASLQQRSDWPTPGKKPDPELAAMREADAKAGDYPRHGH